MKSSLAQNLSALKAEITAACLRSERTPEEITLVAVTKQRTLEEIAGLYDLGVRDFGENRPQTLLERQELFQKPCNWHLIGPLQKNKVNKVIGHTHLIHSVDSLELGQKIAATGVKTSILLQVNVSGEPTKQGLSRDQCLRVYESLVKFPELVICGLMTMAPVFDGTDESESRIRTTFADTKRLLDDVKFQIPHPHLSMGMSGDFQWAIEEGATIIRIGSFLFQTPRKL